MNTRTKGIVVYLLIAFGLAWIPWEIIIRHGISVRTPMFQFAALPSAFAPAFAAFVVRKWITREGFADAGFDSTSQNGAITWWDGFCRWSWWDASLCWPHCSAWAGLTLDGARSESHLASWYPSSSYTEPVDCRRWISPFLHSWRACFVWRRVRLAQLSANPVVPAAAGTERSGNGIDLVFLALPRFDSRLRFPRRSVLGSAHLLG